MKIVKFRKIVTFVIIFGFYNIVNSQQVKDSIPNESIFQMLKYDGITAFGGLKHAYTRP